MSAIAQIVLAALLIGVAIGVGTLVERASEGGAKNIGARLTTAASLGHSSDSPNDGRGAGEALPPFERIALPSSDQAARPNSIVHLSSGDFWVSPVDGKYYRAAMNEAGIWAPLDKDAPGYDADDRPTSPSPLTLVGGIGGRDDDVTATEWIERKEEWEHKMGLLDSLSPETLDALLTGYPTQSAVDVAYQRFPPELQSGLAVDEYILGLAQPPSRITLRDLEAQAAGETRELDATWERFRDNAAAGFARLRTESTRTTEPNWDVEQEDSEAAHQEAYRTARDSLTVSQDHLLREASAAEALVEEMRRSVTSAPNSNSLSSEKDRFEATIRNSGLSPEAEDALLTVLDLFAHDGRRNLGQH